MHKDELWKFDKPISISFKAGKQTSDVIIIFTLILQLKNQFLITKLSLKTSVGQWVFNSDQDIAI